MNRFRRCISLALLPISLCAFPANASDIGKARSRPIDRTYQSTKTIFEVERCFVDADLTGIPSVYRQPDIPGKTTIVYSIGVGVPILVELTSVGSGTTIEIRVQRIGLLKRFPEELSQCT
jgi:hypothetical protein